MSDNDDIEVESDEEQPRFQSAADKRAHHNALERKRRDHIKDSFHSLRDSVPSLQGEKQQASRAQILDKATEYIQYMRRKNHTHQQDIDDLKRQNALLEQQGALPVVAGTPGSRCLKRAEVLGLECAVGKRELIKFFVPGEFTSLPPSWKMQVKRNSVHWRKRGRVPNCRPTTPPQTTASTPTPRAAPSLPSMGARTPAQSRIPKSPKTGRNSGWRPAKLCRAGQQ
ncbi:protein max isoform X4 [Pipistrellus kuhlii]|uniref:protein max isoform X4 n=1 Tax=Pipistrellus kuhlii TaxID=59472 RepID=UPI001E26FE90|nr:protein max isoform X4 [Pipistrellus kuhlii]